VEMASFHENMIQIQSDASINNLNLILEFLISHHIEIRALQEKEPNLETVFLTLTGRNLRD
ncbi:export ABC transporter ATP-binding protein, partial [Anaerostipes hadrus]|nr:export ABC transporter ATP-binding protein [Anaerostipes hadrus]